MLVGSAEGGRGRNLPLPPTSGPEGRSLASPTVGGTAPVTSCLLSICPGGSCLRPNFSLLLPCRPLGPGTDWDCGRYLVSSFTSPLPVWLVELQRVPALQHSATVGSRQMSSDPLPGPWDRRTQVPWYPGLPYLPCVYSDPSGWSCLDPCDHMASPEPCQPRSVTAGTQKDL